ncbi:MAG: Sua5/YciO/YrdC/YwlC family protein [Proteobacteria bacterium]|nr:Sua5/YciO/YrdC/YwlC family protein [Pseudomonadota bacterium]
MSDRLDIPQAVAILRRGGVIAYPTEGVWGVGCDPFDANAVRRLLAIKQREESKGLILIAAQLAQIAALIDIDALPPARLRAVRASWPGPHTWTVPCPPSVPAWLRGAHASIALRVSAHRDVVKLCNAFGGPLVSTSANLSGQPAVRLFEELDPALLRLLDGVLEGETGGLLTPTPIRDAASGVALRA